MNSFKRMLRYIFRYKLSFFGSVFFSVLYAAMNAGSIYLLGPFLQTLFGTRGPAPARHAASSGLMNGIKQHFQSVLDGYLGVDDPYTALTRLCVLIIVIILFKNIFAYLQGYIIAVVEQGVVRDLRHDVYIAYHRLPLSFFQRRKTGDMLSRVINDCTVINDNFNSAFIDMVKEPINIAFLLGVMFMLSWKLTLFMFFMAPPVLYVIARIAKKLRRRTTRSQDRISELTSVLEETISNIRVVKAFAMERFEIGKFDRANDSYFRSLMRLVRLRRLSPPVTEFLGVAAVVLVLWIGGRMVLESRGGLRAEEFMQFIIFMFMLMQSAKRMSDVNVKLQVGIAATGRVFETIDRKSEVANPSQPLPIRNVRESIRFRNVWYEYEPGIPVLRNIDLTVGSGEMLAVIGPSGGGKSTLLDLLPRFFDPTRGSVEIDGVDLRRYDLDDLRRLFGIVTQETILFHDTIRANVAYGQPDIPMEQIIEAAKAANAHDFIMGFEAGYDTVIGDRGTKLSGGQKQRLAIARAILKNPPILLFDEATSALDSESEAEVQSAIEKLMRGRTSFVIAHRLSTVQTAGRIIVMDHGEVVEMGTHAELYRQGEIYRRLHDLQHMVHKSDK